jgi:hypothetical protein
MAHSRASRRRLRAAHAAAHSTSSPSFGTGLAAERLEREIAKALAADARK